MLRKCGQCGPYQQKQNCKNHQKSTIRTPYQLKTCSPRCSLCRCWNLQGGSDNRAICEIHQRAKSLVPGAGWHRPGDDTTELWPQHIALRLFKVGLVCWSEPQWTTVNQATWRFIPSKSMVWINADPSPPVSNWKRIRIRILARTFDDWSSTGCSFLYMFVCCFQLQHSVFHWALQLCLSTMEVSLSYRPSLAPDIRLSPGPGKGSRKGWWDV